EGFFHFTCSTTSGSASLMSLRTRLSTSPRQSCSAAIRASISRASDPRSFLVFEASLLFFLAVVTMASTPVASCLPPLRGETFIAYSRSPGNLLVCPRGELRLVKPVTRALRRGSSSQLSLTSSLFSWPLAVARRYPRYAIVQAETSDEHTFRSPSGRQHRPRQRRGRVPDGRPHPRPPAQARARRRTGPAPPVDQLPVPVAAGEPLPQARSGRRAPQELGIPPAGPGRGREAGRNPLRRTRLCARGARLLARLPRRPRPRR